MQCDDLIKALITKGFGGIDVDNKALNPILCPNGLGILLKLPDDMHAIGEFCSPQSRQVMLDFMQELDAIKSGRDLRCSPCESQNMGTTCPETLGMLGTYSCANHYNNDHCLTCGNECNTSEGERCTSQGCKPCESGEPGCKNCIEETYFNTQFNKCVEICYPTVPYPELSDMTNVPPDGRCGCLDSSKTPCGYECKNINTDVDNCGACGNVCLFSGAYCNSGQCSCFPEGQLQSRQFTSQAVVATASEVCNNQCVDTNTDNNNCGTCGNVCQSGSTCNDGQCNGKVSCNPGEYCESGPFGDNQALCYQNLNNFCFVGCGSQPPSGDTSALCGSLPVTCCQLQTAPYTFPGCQVPGQHVIPNEC